MLPVILVDPLWACVYAVSSIIIGILFFREMPNIAGFVGVAFYLIGAFLMTRG
jgi:drug/metabolite transporter (DMT)-like permease